MTMLFDDAHNPYEPQMVKSTWIRCLVPLRVRKTNKTILDDFSTNEFNNLDECRNNPQTGLQMKEA